MLAYLSGRGRGAPHAPGQPHVGPGHRHAIGAGDGDAAIESRPSAGNASPSRNRLQAGTSDPGSRDDRAGNGRHPTPSSTARQRGSPAAGRPGPCRNGRRPEVDGSATPAPDVGDARIATVDHRAPAGDRPRPDGIPDRDPGPGPRHRGRPRHRLDQARRDPGQAPRRIPRAEGPVRLGRADGRPGPARTLGAIVDRMVGAGRRGRDGLDADRRPVDPIDPDSRSGLIRAERRSAIEHDRRAHDASDGCGRWRPCRAPLPRDRRGLMAGGRVVVTDDGRGVAAELAARLEAAGIAVDRLGGPERPVEWTSPSADRRGGGSRSGRGARSRASCTRCRSARRPPGDPGGEDWSDRIGDAVKGLFLLAKVDGRRPGIGRARRAVRA